MSFHPRNFDRRKFVFSGIAASMVRSSKALARSVPLVLLQDPKFHRGADLLKNKPGSEEVIAAIQPDPATGAPAWHAAEWYSKFELANAPSQKLADGSTEFDDGAKKVIFGAEDSSHADLVLALNGRKEFDDISAPAGSAWPHLLFEQKFPDCPALTTLASVHYRVSFKLLRAEVHRDKGFDPQRHTAQCLSFFTVQNFNPVSKGKGDFLWFGVPLFDARYPQPIARAAADAGNAHKRGTGKFIFNPGGAAYTSKKAIDGDWITIDHDLLPLMKDALHKAWEAGFLDGSKDIRDYRIGGMNIGWEVTGPWDVAMQLRDMEVTVTSA